MPKPEMIIIAGPTGVGKSRVSIELSKALHGEVVSSDSVQVYRGMDIGSAKLRPEEMEGIRHHLIDILDPCQNMDISQFCQMADKCCRDIIKRGKVPIVCGGTGFYIQGLLYGIEFSDEDTSQKENIRKNLERIYENEGGDKLYEMLLKIDPLSCERIHRNNSRRIMRALEYYEIHNSPISLHNDIEKSKPKRYNALFIVLNDEREDLYRRIDQRVDEMFEKGIVEEGKSLFDLSLPPESTSLKGIGYRELIKYFSGEIGSLEDVKDLIKKNSRNYAKRQLTWFKREKEAVWLNINDFDRNAERIAEWIQEKYMSISE